MKASEFETKKIKESHVGESGYERRDGFGQIYGVMASVSGGVTGSRSSWAKKDGKRIESPSFEEMAELAQKYRDSVGLGAGANFSYQAMEIEDSLYEEDGQSEIEDEFNPYDWDEDDETELMASRANRPPAQRRIRAHRNLR